MSENARVTRAAGIVGSATLLSRIFGFLRDILVAGVFGTGIGADAFFVAFRIPNLLRRLFAEGSLSIAFIPVFTDHLENKGREEAFALARSALKSLSLVLVGVTLLGILFAPQIIHVIAPGFADAPEKLALTVALTRIVFPYIFFICLMALSMGILNVLGHFAAPALAPVLLNLAMILSVILLSPHLSEPIFGLGVGVFIGGALQLALQVPFMVRKGFRFWERGPLFHPGLLRVLRLMGPAVFGAAVYQINILVGTLLASLLPGGSVSYLYYADRLVQFPLGIFGIAMATAVLPSLSRQAANRNFDALQNTFSHALNLILFITLPAMVGLIVLREPIVEVLFRRGAFDAQSTRLTAVALMYYSVGLWAFSAVRVVVSTFYSLEDTVTPVRTAVISIIFNILLSLALMGPLRHGGLALATSLSSMINLGLLTLTLKRRLGTLKWRKILESTCKSLLSSAIMGIAVWHLAHWMAPEGVKTIDTAGSLLICVLAGSAVYGILAGILKSKELETLLGIVRGRFKKS